jgi:hypothetical protein
MNRFYDTPGDISRQLTTWELKKRNFINCKKAIFELKEALLFNSTIAGGVIIVPVNFISDLASIPRIAWTVFLAPNDPRIGLGGWIHDFLYSHKGDVLPEGGTLSRPLTRKECDAILAFECMPDLGASKFQQYVVYYLLRLFGASSFNTNPANIRWKFIKVTYKR